MDTRRFADVLVGLSRADVRYLVVGGIACVMNGYARHTVDLDILVDADPANIRRLLAQLESVGDGYARELRVEDFPEEEGAVRLVEDFPIDIFTRMAGRSYADMLTHRRVFREQDVDIPFVDVDGLILLKSGSVRGRDRIDVELLQRLKSGKYGPQP